MLTEQLASSPQDNRHALISHVPNETNARMAWFRAFRGDFGYSHYGDYRTSVTWDVPFAAIIYTCILISVAAIIAAAGIRGKERWYTLVRLVYSLAVGSIILVSLFGYCWQLGEVGVHAPYIYRSNGNIRGMLGIRIGLKTVNLTLKGSFTADESSFNYNEELAFENVIKFNPQTWGALERGLPQPLLSIIEYFDIDDGGLRFGRACFMAGHFANILLWTAFAFWVTGNILLCSVIWYGAACFTLTGVCMIIAVVVYHYLCPQNEVKMPCSDGTLVLSYGWCFWSTLVFGVLTTLVGLVLFTLDQKVPKKLARFFLLDTSLEDIHEDYRLYTGITIINQAQTSTPASTPVSAQNTPNTSLIHVNERGKTSKGAVNWFVNNGFDCQKSLKSNPLYCEQVLDTPFSGNDFYDISRPRTFSNITEEDDQKADDKTVTDGEDHGVVDEEDNGHDSHSDPDKSLDRLSEIYVDVERSNCLPQKQVIRKSYLKELDAMIEKR